MTYLSPTPPPRKRRNVALTVIVLMLAVAGLLFCIAGVVSSFQDDPLADAPAPTVGTAAAQAAEGVSTIPAPPTATTPAKPVKVAPAPVTIAAGTWEVGTEVKPGTYVATAEEHCYWARLRNFDGQLDSIIANDNLMPGQRGRVTIKKSDKGVELNGDCTWTRR